MKSREYKVYTLKWIKTNFSNVVNHDDCYFYAFSIGKNLLYIGNTMKQDVVNRVNQHLNIKFDGKSKGIQIWIAKLILPYNNRVSEKLIRDIECLLIFSNQPPKNVQCKMNYTGREFIKIHNKNFPFIKSNIQFSSRKL